MTLSRYCPQVKRLSLLLERRPLLGSRFLFHYSCIIGTETPCFSDNFHLRFHSVYVVLLFNNWLVILSIWGVNLNQLVLHLVNHLVLWEYLFSRNDWCNADLMVGVGTKKWEGLRDCRGKAWEREVIKNTCIKRFDICTSKC